MKVRELTVTRVGNTGGLRLPADVLRRYKIKDTILLEQRTNEIALRPRKLQDSKLEWTETYREMALAEEDWAEWEGLRDGSDD